MRVKSASGWFPSALVCCALIGSGVGIGAQKASEQASASRTAFDPHALQLLQQMAATYARLPGLDQRTEFYSASVPVKQPATAVALAAEPDRTDSKSLSQPAGNGVDTSTGVRASLRSGVSTPEGDADKGSTAPADAGDPPGEKLKRSLRLLAVQPNLLRLELREYDQDVGHERLSEWVSDGKTFWTYTEENHHYTKETAPVRLHDFAKLNHLNTGSLELLMLLGVDPFAEVRDQVERVTYLGQATVRGVATEVVMLRAVQPMAITEARLYIGKENHLLYRLVAESTPVLKVITPGKVGDELDALVDGRGPTPPPTANTTAPQFATSETDVPDPEPAVPAGPMKAVMAYENIISPLARTNYTNFNFVIPDGALLFEPLRLQTGVYKQPKQNVMDLFRVAGVKKKKKAKVRVIRG
jgi:hypothetical protein